MITHQKRQFLETQRVARLATADADGNPHVIPVCFIVEKANAYITIDQKPKRNGVLKRVQNILENPAVALIADHYDDQDWSQLGWVMLRGSAEILYDGSEHAHAQELLRQRYPQLLAMRLENLPVIAIRVQKVSGWGNFEIK